MNLPGQLIPLVILTEYFPPAGSTAAYRPYAWYLYLHKHGYYPVIFCRNAQAGEASRTDISAQGEVHYIQTVDDPLRERISRTPRGPWKYLLIILHLLVHNTRWYGSAPALRKAADQWLRKNRAAGILASGSPFNLFAAAATLSRKHRIPWIADYRDDWTTNEVFIPNALVGFLKRSDRLKEKRYTRTAGFFLTVSEHYRQKIAALTGKNGYVVENGFLPPEAALSPKTYGPELSILYTGLFYDTQRLDMVLDACTLLREKGIRNFRFCFLGSALPASALEDPNISAFPRVSRHEALEWLLGADALLYLPFYGPKGILKGVPASKLYDYIYSRRPVLLCRHDEDMVFEKLSASGQAVSCESSAALATAVEQLIRQKERDGAIPAIQVADTVMHQNSREYQTALLADILRQNLTFPAV